VNYFGQISSLGFSNTTFRQLDLFPSSDVKFLNEMGPLTIASIQRTMSLWAGISNFWHWHMPVSEIWLSHWAVVFNTFTAMSNKVLFSSNTPSLETYTLGLLLSAVCPLARCACTGITGEHRNAVTVTVKPKISWLRFLRR
jgi:hypothetical protein